MTRPPRAVVFGYHNVGDRCLRVLLAAGVDVALVVTHHDDLHETLWFRRVADTAADAGLPVLLCDDPTTAALHDAVSAARPDLIFSFYYRKLIPPSVLALAPRGAYNLHGSLLPKFRGRAPVNWAVLMGATETGATLHAMTAKPDAGGIVDQTAVPILPDDTATEVFDKVTVAAEQTLWRALPGLLDGTAVLRPNVLADGSYFGGRRPEDGRIDWRQPAARVHDLIRAVAPPYPGAFTDVAGQRLVVAAARRWRNSTLCGLSPGLHVVDGTRIVGICGDGCAIDVRALRLGDADVDAPALAALQRQSSP